MSVPGEITASPRDRVVDASVVVKLFVPEPLSDRAQALLGRAMVDPLTSLLIPDLLYVECANVLWKYVRRLGYPTNRAIQDITRLLRLPLEVRPTGELVEDALDVAIEFEITAYDACYVALARRLGVPLVTADERLVRRFAKKRVAVRWLGDVPDDPAAGEFDGPRNRG